MHTCSWAGSVWNEPCDPMEMHTCQASYSPFPTVGSLMGAWVPAQVELGMAAGGQGPVYWTCRGHMGL